ncbi:MAG TPA: Spo0E family sporulation regulatory protein-aspartic acid phosphatase [Thermoanaerobacterales bacterium]|nr:Spo0E family sporulation regulatory protein-aspartic acid phosphatase [Thermoanaerobacterales bacterium]
MTEQQKLEIAKKILNNAAEINISKSLLLKISQKTDEYIAKYFCSRMKERAKKNIC